MNRSIKWVFLIRTFNDLDHIAPIIWKSAKRGHVVRVVLVDINANLDLKKEALLQFLYSQGIQIHYYYALPENSVRFPNRLLGSPTNPLVVKALRFFFSVARERLWTSQWAEGVLNKISTSVLVTDSHGPNQKDIEGRLIFAAKRLGIPIVCCSHGPNVLINFNATEPGLRRPQKKEKLEPAGYEIYDTITAQTPYEYEYWKQAGFDEKKLTALGSTRYCPEWMQVSSQGRKAYEPSKAVAGQKKVLFFLPHWKPYTNKQGTLQLIEKLAARKDIFLVVKEHTREGAGSLPDEMRARFRQQENTEVIESARSVSLGRWLRSGMRAGNEISIVDSVVLAAWADAMICFNSSVGMEAIALNKPMINLAYLCDYSNFYEALGAGITVYEEAEFFQALGQTLTQDQAGYDATRFNREIIFANRGEHDVLQKYVDLLASLERAVS